MPKLIKAYRQNIVYKTYSDGSLVVEREQLIDITSEIIMDKECPEMLKTSIKLTNSHFRYGILTYSKASAFNKAMPKNEFVKVRFGQVETTGRVDSVVSRLNRIMPILKALKSADFKVNDSINLLYVLKENTVVIDVD